MKNLIAVGLMAALAACGGGKNNNDNSDISLPDSSTAPHKDGGGGSDDGGTPPGCQVLTQTGCNTGEKCTWVLSTDDTATDPGLGAIACAPNGTVAIGGACTVAKVAMGGYDNCVAGAACVSGTCKAICDNNGGAPMCGTNQACVTYEGLFANAGATSTPAGVCDPSCNPLTDNDFDGSGTVFTKTGTACGTSSAVGCYGFFSSTHTTYYTCAPPAGTSATLTHRGSLGTDVSKIYLNSCAPGYHVGEFYADDSGSKTFTCFAYCAPGEAYMGNTGTQAPNGVAPHRCNNNDALGNFGATPNATGTTNGEHCWYSWSFELDDTNAWHKSPTSDTVGSCVDHTKYKYDPTGGSNATDPFPPCVTLPKNGTDTTYGADNFGCVNSTDAMLTAAFNGKSHIEQLMKFRVRNGLFLPEFPEAKMSR